MKQLRTLLKFALIYFLLSLAGGRMSAQDKGVSSNHGERKHKLTRSVEVPFRQGLDEGGSASFECRQMK